MTMYAEATSGPAVAGPLEPSVRRLLARTVVADPPWWPSLHRNTVGRREGPYRAGPQRYYPLLTVEQIEAMAPETERKAHLWLWVLNQHLDWGVRVARAWGFEPQQTLTWCKPGYGTGQFQCNSEQVALHVMKQMALDGGKKAREAMTHNAKAHRPEGSGAATG